MKRLFLCLITLTCFAIGSQAQIVYEDFENGPSLPWNGSFGDGVFNGAVENPADQDPLGINPSDSVGSYTKSNEHAYSLLIAVLDDTLDLSVNNQFSIQINAPVATKVLFKLEGTGENIEQTKNIAVTDRWIQYDFDFSGAAGFTTVNKIIIFFDPGVSESGDTYLFDNIVANPAGPCAGTAPDPLILDDFECQRNGTYGNPGYLDVSPIANPDPSGINTSDMVGEYRDTAGGAWHALVFDWNSPDEFPVTKEGSSVVSIKVWAPVTGILKVKLEAGTSAATEKDVMVTDLNTWVEYKVDFSDQIGASHRKLVFFFNAGVEPGPGDIYYIDDIALEAAPSGSVLEDFEDGAKLNWSSLGDPGVFGTFNGVIANPDATGANESANVGSYTKGSSQFGGLKATLPLPFSLDQFPQLNLQVWAPSDATEFTMKLFSPTQGLKSVTVDITETQAWTDLNFIFSDFQTVTDFEEVQILFDETLVSTDTWYFDNLSQGAGTVDPCEGVEPKLGIIDDFDCQRNVPFNPLDGGFDIITNPDATGINPDPLDKVGQYVDPFTEWSAIVWDLERLLTCLHSTSFI